MRVTEAILALEENPFPPGKKWKLLEGSGGLVHLRVGDYRVLYEVLDDEIHVLGVIRRRDLDRWLRRL
jgi:mRNA-degrading endonuclease RelE of RelBE toxin-antitoxin system